MGRTVECRQPLDFNPLVHNKATAPLFTGRLPSDWNGVLGTWPESTSPKRTSSRRCDGTVLPTQPVLVRRIGAHNNNGRRNARPVRGSIPAVWTWYSTITGSGRGRGTVSCRKRMVACVGQLAPRYLTHRREGFGGIWRGRRGSGRRRCRCGGLWVLALGCGSIARILSTQLSKWG